MEEDNSDINKDPPPNFLQKRLQKILKQGHEKFSL